ncbi:MAG: NAD(P)H-hydrate dehydratase [Prevotellaceae bacterium]|jgi:NAD(P)H-hydrate epimerase|nr:NAD(P)H-hydrate dehydratase [Prevotellaceae bacterium]
MKIFIGSRIKEADRYTIENEPVSSVDLMERASEAIAGWISRNIERQTPLLFVIGKGNNGGDGMAVARILRQQGFDCSVYFACGRDFAAEECRINLERLPADVRVIDCLAETDRHALIVDALLGTGISGNVREPLAGIIASINSLSNKVISIDLPSGMSTEPQYPDCDTKPCCIVKADITLTLEFPKLSMMTPEAGEFAGKIIILPAGLSEQYLEQTETPYHYIDKTLVDRLLKKRSKFGYKNMYGHTLIIGGSRNMIGAAVLATSAALRSGSGLVSAHIPYKERFALQTACPSAILSFDTAEYFSGLPCDLDKYNAIGTGCGWGMRQETLNAFAALLKTVECPLTVDADALNLLALNKNLWKHIPENSVLTPHFGELKRLTGGWSNAIDREKKIMRLAAETGAPVVVKGAHTAVYLPDGNVFFNSTGNSGMAKGGSGDVLTGLIAGLLARGYSGFEAATLGVYFHGLAGDCACRKYGCESMNSFDIVNELRIEQAT